MINMLEAGMTGEMSGYHRWVILRWCWMHFFRGRCGLVFIVVIIAPAVEVLRAFMLVWRAELKAKYAMLIR